MTAHAGKRADRVEHLLRPCLPFESARAAFRAFLLGMGVGPGDEVLLPAYVGWSPKEGSGVSDPVEQVGATPAFYRMTRQLHIDVDDLRAKIGAGKPKLLVIIHFFGFPDPHYPEAVAVARERGVLVLEDEAHAFLSDWMGGVCGRLGDAAIVSLHKLLPIPSGGLLVLNDRLGKLERTPWEQVRRSPASAGSVPAYDLFEIATARRRNGQALLALLQPLAGAVEPLRAAIPEGVVPQTLPVLIRQRSRDDLYFELNDRGYGVVSLYHTLIGPIRESEFPDSHWLARRILNLPVHQDASVDDLRCLVSELGALLGACS